MSQPKAMNQSTCGGNIPSHKNVNEGQGSNAHKNTNQTRIPGDGAVTVRNVSSKPQVKRVQANANHDVSSQEELVGKLSSRGQVEIATRPG